MYLGSVLSFPSKEAFASVGGLGMGPLEAGMMRANLGGGSYFRGQGSTCSKRFGTQEPILISVN